MSARNCQSFVNFCNRAKSSIQTGGATDDNQAMVKCGEAVACAIKGSLVAIRLPVAILIFMVI